METLRLNAPALSRGLRSRKSVTDLDAQEKDLGTTSAKERPAFRSMSSQEPLTRHRSDSGDLEKGKELQRYSQMEVVAPFNPESSAARAESIYEGRGIDSFITPDPLSESLSRTSGPGSSTSHLSKDLPSQSVPGVSELNYAREVTQGKRDSNRRISHDSSFSQSTTQTPNWNSAKWTKAEIWNRDSSPQN